MSDEKNSAFRVLSKYDGPGGAVTVPDDVTVIGKEAFAGCESLTGVVLPDGLIAVEDRAFADCVNLTDIAIPDSVTFIGKDVFLNCRSLRRVKLPDGIDSGTFEKSTGLDGWDPELFQIRDGVLIKYTGSEAEVRIPDGVTAIGENAFASCGIEIAGWLVGKDYLWVVNDCASDTDALADTPSARAAA